METGRTTGAAASSGEAQRTRHSWDEKAGRPAQETGEDANYFERRAATFCGDCLALTLGAATTVSLALLQGGAVLADVCWRAIRRSCCDTGSSTGDISPLLVAHAFHVQMRLSTSLLKRFDTYIKSPCVSTCHVHPVVTTAAHPTLSFLLPVHPTCREEVGTRSISGLPFYKGVPKDANDNGSHEHHEPICLQLPAARAQALDSAGAVRKQQSWVTRLCTTGRHGSSPLRAWRTQSHNVRHTVRASPTLQAEQNQLQNVRYKTREFLCNVPSTCHDRRLVFCYSDMQQHRYAWREQRRPSCCERNFPRRGRRDSRSRGSTAGSAAATSSSSTVIVCHGSPRRQLGLLRGICSAAVQDSPVRTAEAHPDSCTENMTTQAIHAAAACATGGEHTNTICSEEEIPGTTCVGQRAATAAGATSLGASSTKKAAAFEQLFAQTAEVAKGELKSGQSCAAAAEAGAASVARFLNHTTEKLQHAAEQVFLRNSCVACAGSVASKELHSSDGSCREEAPAAGSVDLPWGKVLCLIQRWHQTLVSCPRFVSLNFTSFSLPQNLTSSKEGYYFDRFSAEPGNAQQEVTREDKEKEGTEPVDNKTRTAAVTAPADPEASMPRRREADTVAIEAAARADGNFGEKISRITEYEENVNVNHGCTGKYLSLAISRVPEEREESQVLSFYPPVFTTDDLMSFRLPWHELRNDEVHPHFWATGQSQGSVSQGPSGNGSEAEKPRFWGRYFCLHNFSPTAKSRAKLEQGLATNLNCYRRTGKTARSRDVGFSTYGCA